MALNLHSVSLLQINDQNVDNFSVHETYLILIVSKKNRASSTIKRSGERVRIFSYAQCLRVPPALSKPIDRYGCKIIENK